MAYRVVCIEDDVEMIELLRLLLIREGYDFIGARGGERGVEVVLETKPDLVLLDLMMADLDGWTVYEMIKRNPETSAIPIIIVTAAAQSDQKLLEMRVSKIDHYVVKPFPASILIDLIRRSLSQA
jgi:CheY-like chemotaxis protein